MRVLGIDYGLKRIGIAIADTDIDIAFARDAIASHANVAAGIARLFKEEGCSRVIVGYPLLESGEVGEQAQLTKEFADELRSFGIDVILFDERFTTSAARNNLSHLNPEDRKKLLDSEAARLMLAEYLASLDT